MHKDKVSVLWILLSSAPLFKLKHCLLSKLGNSLEKLTLMASTVAPRLRTSSSYLSEFFSRKRR